MIAEHVRWFCIGLSGGAFGGIVFGLSLRRELYVNTIASLKVDLQWLKEKLRIRQAELRDWEIYAGQWKLLAEQTLAALKKNNDIVSGAIGIENEEPEVKQ